MTKIESVLPALEWEELSTEQRLLFGKVGSSTASMPSSFVLPSPMLGPSTTSAVSLPSKGVNTLRRRVAVQDILSALHSGEARLRFEYWRGGDRAARKRADLTCYRELACGGMPLCRRILWYLRQRVARCFEFAYGSPRGLWDLVHLQAIEELNRGDLSEAVADAAEDPALGAALLTLAKAFVLAEAEDFVRSPPQYTASLRQNDETK